MPPFDPRDWRKNQNARAFFYFGSLGCLKCEFAFSNARFYGYWNEKNGNWLRAAHAGGPNVSAEPLF
jgi:hypothetical protein